jgi:hypothetical protein
VTSGQTFLPVDGADDHLWIVISDTTQDPDELVIVCLLSWRPYHDQACVLHAGEHPFIKHDTCVNYPGALFASREILEARVAEGKIKLKAPISADLLKKIRDSAGDSDMPGKYLKKLYDQGLVDY